MKVLALNHGERIMLFPNGRIMFFGRAMIDADGSGPETPGDTFIPDTTYHFQGIALNSHETNFIAVPPAVILGVNPTVLGCHVRVRNMQNNLRAVALVGDVAPTDGIGEISVALAKELGVPPSPINGGMDEHDMLYEIFPGIPASCNGRTWPLQPYR